MDVKLGEAKVNNQLPQHADISADAARDFLELQEMPPETLSRIVFCVREHHNTQGFTSLESEVVANTDCYRFASVAGNFYFVSGLLGE